MFATTPPQERGLLVEVARGSFASALDEILLISAIVTLAAGILSFLLIRSKDFVSAAQPDHAAAPGGRQPEGQHDPAAVTGSAPGHHEEP